MMADSKRNVHDASEFSPSGPFDGKEAPHPEVEGDMFARRDQMSKAHVLSPSFTSRLALRYGTDTILEPAQSPPCNVDPVADIFRRSYWQDRPLRWWLAGRWWPGVLLPELLLCIAVALVLIFAVPCPQGLTSQSWALFGVFIATIVGLILRPLPMGGVCLMSVVVTLWSGLLSFPEAFDAFTDKTVWLIVSALLMAEAVDKTGLGYRVSLLFIRAFGHTALGLTYALMLADLILAMGMPSTTAREGGVFLPILRGICQAFGSYPGDWVVWVMGACLPAIVIMAVTPLVVYWVYRPEITRTPQAPAHAKVALKNMGRLSYGEAATLSILVFAVAFWISGSYIKTMQLTTTSVALMALALMLLAGVLTWQDCLAGDFAWDILFWMGILMSMSNALTKKGVMDWFAGRISNSLLASGVPPVGIWILLLVSYCALHYLFASQSAHVAALYTPFLVVMMKCGISPVLSAMSLAYIGNAITGMTHYASAESVVYFTQRYYSVRAVFLVGAIMTLLNLGLWIPIGLGWWKVVGFYSDIYTMT